MDNNWVCIDFGTCNTAAAILIDGCPQLVHYANMQYFPTLACVIGDSSIEVCQNAEPLRRIHPETFKQEFKLQIAEHLDIGSVTYTDIVAQILSFVKGCAEIENNGVAIDNVLLTIPAVYTESDPRKTVMTDAAVKAGFSKVEFMTEPTAAARYYAYVTASCESCLSLVYDLGGGTLDLSLVETSARHDGRIIGTESGIECGGNYFDNLIYKHIKEHFAEEAPLKRDARLDDYAACRRLKEALSVKDTATQYFSNGMAFILSRQALEALIAPMINRSLVECDSLLQSVGKTWADISRIILVGGSTSIPLVVETMRSHLVSYNAPDVEIIRNAKGCRGVYNNLYATSLGGISTKARQPLPTEDIACLYCGDDKIQLKMGENTFGRSSKTDFTFPDPSMSRHHFTVNVTKDADGHHNYSLTTKSTSRSTIVNNTLALDLRYVPVSLISVFLNDGDVIKAGRTKFIFKK